MKEEVFSKFHELYFARGKKLSPLQMGEDAVRYDFFVTLMEVNKLEPSDLWLEYPKEASMYTAKLNEKGKRKEKPLINLLVKTNGLNIAAGFAVQTEQ